MPADTTTLICLFHHQDHAEASLQALHQAGIPPSSISTIAAQQGSDHHIAQLNQIGVPERDLKHLHEGLHDGGVILAVEALTGHVETVERIFADNKAKKIDETGPEAFAASDTSAGTVIPIVEEEMQVGKRTVDQGGVRVFRRVVEMPAEASVNLREEHVVIERNPVDRIATAADLAAGDRVIELNETAEEAVVGKTAHVVEEVVVGKQVTERTERIIDTVRRTEVDVDELPASTRSL